MIVITGGAGFIGSVLVWKFNLLGLKNILVVDQFARNTPKWNNVKQLSFAGYCESDEFIHKLEQRQYDGKLSAIFHMGACSDTTEADIQYLKKNNTEYSQRLARWCLDQNVYLAYASSAAVYGDGTMGFSDDDMRTPLLKPLNPYGRSKLDFDVWAIQNGFQKLITGFRFFNVYGPNEGHKGAMRSMVHKGFEQVRDTGKMRLFRSYHPDFPDGGQKRDFVYVKDIVEAMLWFYENPAVKGIFNLGSGHAQSWNELACALFKASGSPEVIEYFDMPENLRRQYQYFTEADLAKLRRSGCPVRFRLLEDGVADYVRSHLGPKHGYLS